MAVEVLGVMLWDRRGFGDMVPSAGVMDPVGWHWSVVHMFFALIPQAKL